jgi:hypothetical protein
MGEMSLLKQSRFVKLVAVLALLTAALIAAGCGGSDKKKGGSLSATASADHFAGPVPLNVKFSAKAQHTTGNVLYRWRFDDGTSSEQQNPTHSFPRAGYYTVIVDVRDESGNNTRQSLLLGAWPPKQWAAAQHIPLTKKRALNTERVQQRRTDARHRDLRKALLKAAAQG